MCCLHTSPTWRRRVNVKMKPIFVHNISHSRIQIIFPQNLKGCLMSHWIDTRLVCTHLNTIFMLNPNIILKIWISKKVCKKLEKFEVSSALVIFMEWIHVKMKPILVQNIFYSQNPKGHLKNHWINTTRFCF